MQYKYYIFDMDGTLTPSRSQMSDEMYKAFWLLVDKAPVVIISGAMHGQIRAQLLGREDFSWPKNKRFWIMSQSGNFCASYDTGIPDSYGGKCLWNLRLSTYERMEIFSHIHRLFERYKLTVRDADDLIQDRGCQVSYSLIGHNESLGIKRAFDPEGKARRVMLDAVPFKSKTLTVKVGGTTCLDYTRQDGTKANNLRRLLGEYLTSSVYVGDQLYPGGNDSDVLGIEGLAKHAVKGPQETLHLINNWIGK